jgi:Kdo2-lipid IVA 3' secondary acyltransferase
LHPTPLHSKNSFPLLFAPFLFVAKIRIRSAGKLLAWLMRGIGSTLTVTVEDRAGVFDPTRPEIIWAFWHNKMFLFPWLFEHWFPDRDGTVLTSPSGDGQVIADVCAEFGLIAARGSSSKPQKGMSALILLAEQLKAGSDIGITPDGPRGPCFQLQPGIVKLAQLTGSPILPARVHYSRSLKFNTWDRFELPLPGARVTIVLDPYLNVPRRLSEEQFENLRAELETTLRQPFSSIPA